MLYSIIMIVCIVGLCVLYYYYPRTVPFELAKEIQKPHKEFDNSQFIGFEYADSKSMLIYWLVEHYKTFYPQEQLYDSIFVETLVKKFDFEKYDYIIAYQKELIGLKYSPYLTRTKDGLYYDKKTPLIPTFKSQYTDKIYVYKIKKNNKFRPPGP